MGLIETLWIIWIKTVNFKFGGVLKVVKITSKTNIFPVIRCHVRIFCMLVSSRFSNEKRRLKIELKLHKFYFYIHSQLLGPLGHNLIHPITYIMCVQTKKPNSHVQYLCVFINDNWKINNFFYDVRILNTNLCIYQFTNIKSNKSFNKIIVNYKHISAKKTIDITKKIVKSIKF